jgi:hypothetical protein
MRPGGGSVERIRRHEVSRALKQVNVSPEEAGVIDLLSRSLVGRLLHGPISEVLARAEVESSFGGRPSSEVSYGLERHRGGNESPGLMIDHRICEEAGPYIMRSFEFRSDQVSNDRA